MNERLKKILEFTRGPDVLHVGCVGSGNIDSPFWLHGLLTKKFPNMVGIDINADKVRELREKGFDVQIQNAEDMDFERKFDTIVAGELIEHLSNTGKFLESAAKHLKPDGRLIITTPYPFALMNVIYATLKFPKTCPNPEHTQWFCISTLKELARRYGYRVVYISLVEDYYPGVSSLPYKLFKTFVRPLLPKRLRGNAILAVLEKEK